MSLSDLLARMKPAVAERLAQVPPLSGPCPSVVLFFSLGMDQQRAQVMTVSGADWEAAWQQGTRAAQQWARKSSAEVTSLRVDWVASVQTSSWTQLHQHLSATKRFYFRFGLALDAGFEQAYLEQELNANAMLYVGGDQVYAQLNEKNFTTYAQRKYGADLTPDFSPQAPVWVFTTDGLWTGDDSAEVSFIPGARSADWRAPDNLFSGHRQLDAPTPDQVYAVFDSAGEFLAGQVDREGRFVYGWFPCFDRKVKGYNALRHASTVYAMLEGWEETRSSRLWSAIERALAYVADTLIHDFTLPDGSQVAYLVDTGDEIKLGANAVSLLAMVKFTQLSGDERYLPLMERLALGMAHMQDADSGRFVHVLNAPDLSLKEQFRIIYYDGEAAFGLMRLYGLTRDARWLDMVEKAFEYFIANDLYKAKDHWLSYCVNELTLHRPDEKYFRFGIQNFIHHLDFILTRETTYPTLLELCMAAEKMLTRMAALPEMQSLLQTVDVDRFYQALHYRARYLFNGFFWPEMAMYFQHPARIAGSFMIRHHSFRVRIDDIQHYLSGLVHYRRLLLRQNSAATPLAEAPVPAPSLAVPAQVPQCDIEALAGQPANGAVTPLVLTQEVVAQMSPMHQLKAFDPDQLFRLFVDGRFHVKYQGWVGYEAGERGSVQALLNGLAFMLANFDVRSGLSAPYLLDLHKVCMLNVETRNLKSSPGDLRFLNSGMPFFAKTTTRENIGEILAMRAGDGTAVFNTASHARVAEQLDADEVYATIVREGRLNFRNWYPNLSAEQQRALDKQSGLVAFYDAKHWVQRQFAQRVEEMVARFNRTLASTPPADERLRAIALLVRELELLHPFPDGNCRTFACVLLTQLLLNHGFSPALLENPNLDGEYSLAQWTDEIRQGMTLFAQLLQDPQAPVYGFSIADARPEDRQTFADMAKDVRARLDAWQEIYLTPERLQAYTGGVWVTPPPAGLTFTGVGTYNTYGRGNVYFACELDKWQREGRDCRQALARVLSRDIRALVVDRDDCALDWPIPVLRVDNAYDAFKQAAIAVRQGVNPFTVLITGTEGKSGAKVQLHHLAKAQTQAHAVLNSANTEVPVLRSLITLAPWDRMEINEVSVGGDEALRLERTRMVNPDLCLFTNIGPNHMDMHKTMDNLLWAKSSVVEGLREGGLCLLNADNAWFDGLKAAVLKRRPGVRMETYGSSDGDAAQLLSAEFDAQRLGWQIRARVDEVLLNYFLPLIQQHAPLASVGVLLALRRSGLDVEQAARDYASVQPFETMGQVVRLPKDDGEILFYDQSRRGGISGMRSAFADVARLQVPGRVVALVGGISVLRDGEWTQEAHEQLAGLINDSPIDCLYTSGNYMDYVHQRLTKPLSGHSMDADELAGWLARELKAGDLLFIIGSAYLYLGRVADKLVHWLKQGGKLALAPGQPASYRMLLVYRDVAKGVTAARATAEHGLHYSDYQDSVKRHRSFTAYRGSILMGFFDRLPSLLASEVGARCVNEEMAGSDFASALVSERFCQRWFNNLDKVPGVASKQLFGQFYDIGDPHCLLHVQVATENLHLGLVGYQKVGEAWQRRAMSEQEAADRLARLPDELAGQMAYRRWGPKWLSMDLGRIIEVTDLAVFELLQSFGQSDLFAQRVRPLLMALQGGVADE